MSTTYRGLYGVEYDPIYDLGSTVYLYNSPTGWAYYVQDDYGCLAEITHTRWCVLPY